MTVRNAASPSPDRALLQRYAADRDEAAFQALVRMRLPLVHGVARRVTGNDELARDVAQEAFVRLAQRAALLPADLPLTAWLHRVTHHLAIDAVRSEEQRRKREQRHAHDPSLHATMKSSADPDPGWSQLAPVIDELVNRLPEKDRRVLLLRYYDNQPHAAVARSLGLSEIAARKRSLRALDKLRLLLKRQGIATTGAALSTILPGHAATAGAVSPALAGSIATAIKGVTPALPHAFSIHLAMTTAQKSSSPPPLVIFMGSLSYSFHRTTDPDHASRTTPASLLVSREEDGGASRHRRTRESLVTTLPDTEEGRMELLRRIMQIRDGLSRKQELLTLAALLRTQPELYQETASHYLTLDPKGQSAPDLFIILSDWVQIDPAAAAGWELAGRGTSSWALHEWATKDPEAALSWTLDHVPNLSTPDFNAQRPLIVVLGQIAESDPKAALKVLDRITGTDQRAKAIDSLASELSAHSQDAFIPFLEAIKDDPAYAQVFTRSLSSLLTRGQGDWALDQLLGNTEAQALISTQNFFSDWAQIKPQDAMARLERMSPGPQQDQAAAGVALADHSGRKLTLLDQYPGAATDMVLAKVLETIPTEMQPAGVDHALLIHNVDLRDQTLILNLQIWLRVAPGDARPWIQSHELSEPVRRGIAVPIPQ